MASFPSGMGFEGPAGEIDPVTGTLIAPRPSILAAPVAVKAPATPLPAPKPLPLAAEEVAVKEAAKTEAEEIKKKKRGFSSTILTGPTGLLDPPSLLKATLG
jgi:hypothetical protein